MADEKKGKADQFYNNMKKHDEFRENVALHHATNVLGNYFYNVRFNGKEHSKEIAEKEILGKLEKIAEEHGLAKPKTVSDSYNKKMVLDFFGIDQNQFNRYLSADKDTYSTFDIARLQNDAYQNEVQQHIATEATSLDDITRKEIINKGIKSRDGYVVNMDRATTDQNISNIAVNYVLGEGNINSKTAKSLRIWDKKTDNNYKNAA